MSEKIEDEKSQVEDIQEVIKNDNEEMYFNDEEEDEDQ